MTPATLLRRMLDGWTSSRWVQFAYAMKGHRPASASEVASGKADKVCLVCRAREAYGGDPPPALWSAAFGDVDLCSFQDRPGITFEDVRKFLVDRLRVLEEVK